MHNAPAVSFPVGRSRFEGQLLLAIFVLVGVVVALWMHGGQGSGWGPALALMVWLCTGLWAGWRWFRGANAVLRWDGQQWQFEFGAIVLPGRAIVQLDLQSWMLVQFVGEDRKTHWCWLACDMQVRQWGRLRRALFARTAMLNDGALADHPTRLVP